MPSLPELQAAFGTALIESPDTGFKGFFLETDDVLERRFLAYRRNVWGNWRAALASTYPVIRWLVGGEWFQTLADQYLETHPSQDGDLNTYGQVFPGFLQVHPIVRDLPYLPDMARLEWALLATYGAADPKPFDFQALAALEVERRSHIIFELWPGATAMESRYPVAGIWLAHRLDEPSERDAALGRIDLTPSWHGSLVVRDAANNAVPLDLSPGEYAFWMACRDGQVLESAMITAMVEEKNLAIGDLLLMWVKRKLITGFHLP
ncbi:MAG: DNA-binding domain-containing protein [Pseudomonadota bacterium]